MSDLTHFLRPNIWIYVLAVWLIALLASNTNPLSSLLLVPIFIMICSASITFNHYCDYETDRKSRQLYRFPVASGVISRKTALAASILLMAVPAVLSYLFLSSAAFYLILFSDFMVFSYSARPLRIKERPYIETFWNGIGYGSLPYYITLVASHSTIDLNLHLLGLLPFLVSASGHILLQVRDIRDDKKGRVSTTSTELGKKRMLAVSKMLVGFAGLVIAYLAAIGFLSAFAWLSLAVGALVYLEHRRMKKVEKSYRRLQLAYIVGGFFFFLSLL